MKTDQTFDDLNKSAEALIEVSLAGEFTPELPSDFASKLVKTALRKSSGPEMAAEILQMVTAKVLLRKNANTWNPTKNPAAYLQTIVYKETADVWRKRSRESSLAPNVRQPQYSDPLAVVDAKDSLTWFMDQLTVEHREILQLRNIEGRSVAEVAEILKVSESTVKMRTKRALEELREIRDRQPSHVLKEQMI